MLSRGFVVQQKYLQSKPCDKFSSTPRAEILLNFLENREDRESSLSMDDDITIKLTMEDKREQATLLLHVCYS